MADLENKLVYDMFRLREENDPIHISYELPDLDYEGVAEVIENRIKKDIKLDGVILGYPCTPHTGLVWTPLKNIEPFTSLSFGVVQDKGKCKLLFTIHKPNTRKIDVLEKYQDMTDKVYEIVKEEGRKLQIYTKV